jgi:DNA-binding NarL/FixJ family response regulator
MRPRVLLADDHPGVVKALGRVLSLECDVVGVIADATKIVDAASRLQPVVTVVDLNLPNHSGLDVCREITQKNPRAKVIVITAMMDDLTREQAIAAGASTCFDKCAPAGELVDAIKHVWKRPT